MNAPSKRIVWAPDWVRAWGEDEFGLFADLEFAKVVQRMRWIPPGNFLMGSPENELERRDELQHEVRHTGGFWLADTACTQELWMVVMGKTPSHFTESEEASRPVHNVSWEDCDRFMKLWNATDRGLDLRLPTEAEWEYACRAGTTTPFSFGTNVTPEQVNYNGNVPYAGGKKGHYREKTVPVKSLPPNAWGLYEMHGNVDEWCWDWWAQYETGPAIDPVCHKDTVGARVLRGGSWNDYARYARSADRHGYPPGNRHFNFGFRLARGRPIKQEEPAGGKEREALRRRSGVEDGAESDRNRRQGGNR